MFKNTASQKITLLAIDTAANVPKTGDAANITAYVAKDDGAVTALTDTSAAELDATNAPGLYSFDVSQAETNGDKLLFSAKSSTSGIKIVPQLIYTHPTGGIASPTNITVVGGVTGLTNATIADAVWDETLTDHLTLGTCGYYVGEIHTTGDLLYTDWENGGRLDLILDARASQASVDDVPTVAEFEARTLVAASYGTAANQATIAGYIDTEVAAILAAVDTEVAAIKAKTDQLTFTVANQVDSNALSGGSGLDAAGVRAAVGLASANLDTQLADLPTVSEFNARTLAAAAYFDPGADTVTTTDAASVSAIKAKTDQLVFTVANQVDANALTVVGTADDAVLAAIAALNNLSAAQVNAECDTALSDVGVTLARMGALTDWIDGGRLDAILDTIASNVAAVLLDTGTDGVALSAALCNKIADHVRRRTQANVEASSDGDTLSKSSHYGAIQQIQKSNTTDTAGLLTIKKTDGTTLGTLTLTSDGAAEPATGLS